MNRVIRKMHDRTSLIKTQASTSDINQVSHETNLSGKIVDRFNFLLLIPAYIILSYIIKPLTVIQYTYSVLMPTPGLQFPGWKKVGIILPLL